MKYLIVPIAIFTALLSGIQTKAQTAPFAIYSASDSTWGPMCLAPSTIDFYMYGVAGAFNPQIDVVTCAIHYGDGTSDTVNVNVYGDFTYADFWAATQHEYTAPGTYTVYYEAWGTPLSGTTFYYDSLIVSNEIIISDTCGSVSGTAYYDTNNNCVYDAGELPMPNLCIALYEGGQAVAYDYTDADGSYDFDAPINGTYEVQLLSQTFNNVCPGNVQSVGAVPNTSLDFALFCDTAYFDLAGTLSAWQVRPGFDGYLYLFLSNNGCLPQSGTATIVLDPVTTYNGYCSQPNAITANGSTLTIDFAALVGGQDGALFQIGIYTDPAAFLNTQACFLLNVTPTTGDSDPANNSDNYCFTVTNSWDPNDKAVTPANGPDGAVMPNTEMTYTVRFQNTGTAEAVNVFLLDTIDAHLDLNTFRVITASHAMQTYILPDRTVKFNFPDINLPDSSANEVASHGLVVYSIRQNADLPEGTVFENTAHIYFDFNPAVVTNTTVSTIDLNIGVAETGSIATVSLFPNPTSAAVRINGLTGATAIELIDAMGRVVLTTSLLPDQNTIDMHSLPAGTYILRLMDAEGVKVARVVRN